MIDCDVLDCSSCSQQLTPPIFQKKDSPVKVLVASELQKDQKFSHISNKHNNSQAFFDVPNANIFLQQFQLQLQQFCILQWKCYLFVNMENGFILFAKIKALSIIAAKC